MDDTMREAYERAYTGSNRTAAAWAAFKATWRGDPAETPTDAFRRWMQDEGLKSVGLESAESFARRCWNAGRTYERALGAKEDQGG